MDALKRHATCVFSLFSILLAATSAIAAIPQIFVVQENEQFTLPLVDLQIRTTLVPPLARTEFYLTYKNEGDRDLEGQFLFPLPASATVVDLGLYFNDVLRHASVVEREAARTAYDQIVARMTDPGLAEWMSENVFSLHVFPIPGRGEKKIYVAYEEEMMLQEGRLEYFLDLSYRQRIRRFQIDVKSPEEQIRVKSSFDLIQSNPGEWSARFFGILLEDEIRVISRLPKLPKGVMEQMDASNEPRYFCMALKTPIRPSVQQPESDLILFLDVSGSSSFRDDEKLFEFLSALFQAQQLRLDVTVVPFHVVAEPWILLEDVRSPSGFAKFKRQILRLPRAGATNLTSLFDQMPEILQNLPRSGRILLVTDGIQTLSSSLKLGKALEKFAALQKSLLVISATKSLSISALQKIAHESNGWFIDLLGVKKIDRAVEQAMAPPYQVALYQADPSVQDLQLQQRGELLWIYGTIFPNANDFHSLILRYQKQGGDDYQAVRFNLVKQKDIGMIKNAFGRAALQELLSSSAVSDEEFLKLGKKFHLVTPRTSLLVLESWQDYQHYDVEMPEDVRREYDSYLAQQTDPSTGQVTQASVISQSSENGFNKVYGQILDDKNAPLPGTTILLQHSSGTVMTTTSNADGNFAFENIPAGDYGISAALEGFIEGKQSAIRVTPMNSTYMRFELRPSLTEQFTVMAETPPVEVFYSTSEMAPEPDVVFQADGVDSDVYEPMMGVEFDALNTLNKDERRTKYADLRKHFTFSKKFYMNAFLIFQSSDLDFATRILLDSIEAGIWDADILRLIFETPRLKNDDAFLEALFDRAMEVSIRDDQIWLLMGKHFTQAIRMEEAESCASKIEDGNLAYQLAKLMYPESDETNSSFNEPADSGLQIVLLWDQSTDIDLHVTEPSGQEVFYNNKNSASGGSLSEDVTNGYGPEVFRAGRMIPGDYKIDVIQFTKPPAAPTHAMVTIHRKNSNGEIESENFTIALTREGERKTVTSIHVD